MPGLLARAVSAMSSAGISIPDMHLDESIDELVVIVAEGDAARAVDVLSPIGFRRVADR